MPIDGNGQPPSDLIELGAVHGAYGLKGWVRITPYTADAAVLRGTERWWVRKDESVRALEVVGARRHSGTLLAKWRDCETPEAADAYRGAKILVARSDFPPAPQGSYYWADLIGARVVNRAGEELGVVSALRNNGAQDVLEVMSGATLRLVPLVESYVDRIDIVGHRIDVDWQADW